MHDAVDLARNARDDAPDGPRKRITIVSQMIELRLYEMTTSA